MESTERLRVYDFHALRLGYVANDAMATALEARLGRFTRCSDGACDVRFEYRSGSGAINDPPPPEDARLIYESPMGQVLYSETTDRMYISSVWPIRALCDPRTGETTITVDGAVDEHLWALSHPLMTIPLIETLKRRGRFSVHAAGVAIGNKGLVIPGSSGSGKSTLALALAREGFGFLGDDMMFIVRNGTGLQAQAFPEAFDLTDETVRLFPDLADLLQLEKPQGWPKNQLRVEDRFGSEIVWKCRPAVIVFPRVANTRESKLTPMDAGEALLEILPNILLTEPTSSQQHLDVLTELVSSAACYRLHTGTDFIDLAARLRALLEDAS